MSDTRLPLRNHCPYWHGRHYFAPVWYSDTAVVKRCKCGKLTKEKLEIGTLR